MYISYINILLKIVDWCVIIGIYRILFLKIPLACRRLAVCRPRMPIDGVAKMPLQASIFVPGGIAAYTEFYFSTTFIHISLTKTYTGVIMDKIAVLIPCYNESKTIGKVVRDFKELLPESVIYVYDNNSDDDTAEIAAREGAVVRYERAQGKGNVIRRMFREIDAQAYIMIDGDDTYPAENAAQMIELVLEDGADMVVGDRLSSTYFTENKRPFHNMGNTLVRAWINRLFDNDIKDVMTGYRAFSYNFVKTFPVLSRGFEIETEMTIHAVDKKMTVRNVIIDYRDRPDGSESKLNTYSDGMKVLWTILRLFKDYRPKQFFTLLSAILMLIAGAFFMPILITYFQTGNVPKIPTLFVCGFVALAAIQAYFSGMILSTLIQKNKQDFEHRLIQSENEFKRLMREQGVKDEISK